VLRGRLQMVTDPQDLQVGTAFPWEKLSLVLLWLWQTMFQVMELLKGK